MTQTLTIRFQKQSSRLFDLPPELWIRICRFAVVKGKITIRNSDDNKEVARAVAQPALTRTCKVLREEALKLFYAANEFSFCDKSDTIHSGLRFWLYALGPQSAALVKNCSVVSKESDVVQYVAMRMGICGVRFQDGAPLRRTMKELKFTVQVSEGKIHKAV